MKKTTSEKRVPKPVTAWWFVGSDGNLVDCLYKTRIYCMDDLRATIRVLAGMVTP